MRSKETISQRRRTALRLAMTLLAVVLGALAFTAAGTSAHEVGPLSVTVQLMPAADGGTTLAFPPFGSVSADTHAGPLDAVIRLEEVDIAGLEALAAGGLPNGDDIEGWTRSTTLAVLGAGAKGAAAALVVAGLAAFALTRSRRLTAITLAVVVAVCGGTLGLAAATFEPGAFSEPTFNGALSYAPGAISLVQDRLSDIEGLQRQIRSLASDLAAYYGVEQSFTGGGSLPDTYRVLHVSDLHLDPVGMQLTLDLARAYDAELILDTGDISHFGTEQEAALAVAQMGGRPYVFVPGNHDAPQLVSRIAASGVTVLDGETTTTARGLVILGIGDPASLGPGVEPDSRRAIERGQEIADARARDRFDVVAVHDPATGRPFAGLTPLVVSGHTHTQSYTVEEGTVFLGSGTTGGVHFTELRPDPHIPHGASILYFSLADPHRLVAIDQIEVYGKTSQSSIRRTVIAEGGSAAGPWE